MTECESCAASACPEGACNQCIGAGRHERLGRGLPPREQVRKRSGTDIFCAAFLKSFGEPPVIPALPANPSREIVQQVGAFMLLKGIVAALTAMTAVLRAA
jgi:hypothetical protein